MRPLFECWKEVSERLRKAPKIALFLDFDGTLARFRSKPVEVSLETSLRQSLATLARSSRFFVWVISGRRQSDIRERVKVPGIRYLGLHGWEGRSGPVLSESATLALAGVKSWAGGLFAKTSDVWIEDKGFSLAIHHSETVPDGPPVGALVEGVVEPFKDVLRIAPSRNVSEVLPLELEDKGAAVKHQLAAFCSSAVPIYVGDDSIDEPAFATLRSGVTIHVGRTRRTMARYGLSGVVEVRLFLKRLEAEFA